MFATSPVLRKMLALSACFNGASAKEHTVTFSDSPVWTVGFGVTYADLSIAVGDSLAFVSYAGHDVALVHTPSSGTHWDQCGSNGIGAGNYTKIFESTDFTTALIKKHYAPPTCGEFYIACSIAAHCMFGQRVKVTVNNVDGTPCASPCINGACVTSGSKSLSSGATEHALKPRANSKWWGTGPYDKLEVDVGDTVLFQTGAGFHDVATVPTKTGFDDCNMAGHTVVADWTYGTQDPSTTCKSSKECCAGSSCGASGDYVTYIFNASNAGDTYFVCSVGGHCVTGQKLHVKVKATAAANNAETASLAIWLSILFFVSSVN